MLGHKTSLNKFKKIQIISSIFSYHNSMKLKINNRRKVGKFTNMWKWNNTLLNNQLVKEEIKREIQKYFETSKNGNTTYQNLWGSTKAVLRGKFITIKGYIKRKKEKSQINNPTLHSKNFKKNRLSSKLAKGRK